MMVKSRIPLSSAQPEMIRRIRNCSKYAFSYVINCLSIHFIHIPRVSQLSSIRMSRKRERGDAPDSGSEQAELGLDVFVSGLPYSANEDDIRNFFDGCGDIASLRAPTYQDSGRLRGYAHITFKDEECIKKALEKDGQYIEDRFISVERAKAPGANTKKAKIGTRPAGCSTLYIRNLPYDTDEETVKTAFSRFGNVLSVRLARWNHTNNLKGFGYVQFEHGYSAESAVKEYEKSIDNGKNAIQVGGRSVTLDWDAPGAGPKASFRTSDRVYFKKTEESKLAKGAPKSHSGSNARGQSSNFRKRESFRK